MMVYFHAFTIWYIIIYTTRRIILYYDVRRSYGKSIKRKKIEPTKICIQRHNDIYIVDCNVTRLYTFRRRILILLFFFFIIIALCPYIVVMCSVQSSGRALRTSVNRRVYLYICVWKTLWRSLVPHPSTPYSEPGSTLSMMALVLHTTRGMPPQTRRQSHYYVIYTYI